MTILFTAKAHLKRCVFVFLPFVFSFSLHALCISSDFIHIYSNSSGTSLLGNANIDHKINFGDFSVGFGTNYNKTYSSLEDISFSSNLVNVSSYFDTKFASLKANAFYVQLDDFLIHINTDYKIEKTKIFGASFSLPLKFSGFIVEPFFSLGKLTTQNGDMNYFYSEPEIPFFYFAGANFQLGNFKFSGFYNSNEIDFYSDSLNGSEKLIDSKIWMFGALSRYIFSAKNFNFEPATGFLHIDCNAKGSLNSSNQKYLFFPYKFFNLDGATQIDALLFAIKTTFSKDFFTFHTDFDVIFCINQTGSYNAIYLYKKYFFDGTNGQYSGDFNELQGNGLGFLTFASDFLLPIKKSTLLLSAKKVFLIPLFFNLPSSSSSSLSTSDANSDDATKSAIYYLLSGLSISAKLVF